MSRKPHGRQFEKNTSICPRTAMSTHGHANQHHAGDEIIQQDNFLLLVHNVYIYMEIRAEGMYGLPQAGILAKNELLAKCLALHGYTQTIHMPSLWKYATLPIQFSLIVDDYGVNYVEKQHADHFVSALKEHYEAATDWDGVLLWSQAQLGL
jgi:hypothetical protein